MITCYDSNGKIIKALYQWDTQRIITLRGEDFTDVIEVHLSHEICGAATTILPLNDGSALLDHNTLSFIIPNALLQVAKPLIIYLYRNTPADENMTSGEVRVPIRPRARPTDYVDEEAEREAAELQRRQNELLRIANENARRAAEEARVTAEQSRVNAELARQAKEDERIAAELIRIANEQERIAHGTLYIATYGETTYDEISNAITDLKAVMVRRTRTVGDLAVVDEGLLSKNSSDMGYKFFGYPYCYTVTPENSWSVTIMVDDDPTADSENLISSGTMFRSLATKQDAEDGKGLSTHDYTDEDKEKVDTIPTKISDLINDADYQTEDEVDQKINDAMPTRMSELENDSGYQTAPQVATYMDGRLTRYYTSESTDTLLNRKADSANTLGGYHITDAYTKTEIDNMVGAAYHYVNSVDLLSDLPVAATKGDIMYVGETQLSYVWNGTTWSTISALGDLSGIISDADNMRKVLPNSTLSGATVSFENDVDGLYFDDVEISIVERQPGSDAPSPTNVRPLVGYTSANIYLSPDTTEESARVTTVEFPDELGTIYRGTLNVTTGELRVTAGYIKLVGDGTEGISVYSVPRYKVRAPGFVAAAKATKMSIKANCLDTYPLGQSGTAYRICQGDSGTNYIVFNLGSAVSSVALANEWLATNNLEIVYPLATPKIYQLTPAQIQMLLGQNYLWADTGNVSASFLSSIEGLIDSTAKTIEDANYTNVYDPTDPDILENKQINREGVVSSWSNGRVSGYIPCKAGDVFIMPFYTSHFGTGTSARGIPLFDADKQYINYVTGTLISVGSAYGDRFIQFTVTGATSAYFRVTSLNKDVNSNDIETAFHTKSMFMVIKGGTFPDRFYPYGQQRVIADNIYSAHENLNNPLFGKKAVFLGDSICEGDYLSGWAGRIGGENCMCWENEGVGGSCISNIYSSGKTICTRAIKTVAPDYVIFEGGTNDADRIGDITGGNIPAAFGSFTADNWGTNDAATYYGFDIGTFCGALEYLCKRLISGFAGAKIGYIVAQKMGSGSNYRNRRAYFETAMQICKKWGVPVLNLWDSCYLNPANPAHYTSGSESSMYIDGQHLTPKGYDYITSMIAAWMKTL